jgi:cell division protein ZapA
MAKNKVYVRINGSEYTIIGEEAEDYLFLISRFLDKKIKETLAGNPKHSNTSAAVLAALTITDDLFKLRKENAELKNVIKEPEDKLISISNDLEEINSSYEKVCKEYENYKQKMEEEKEDTSVVQAAYNELYESYIKKNEAYDGLLSECLKLRESNEQLEREVEAVNEKLSEFKSELLEREIENVKINKEFKDFRGSYGKRTNK